MPRCARLSHAASAGQEAMFGRCHSRGSLHWSGPGAVVSGTSLPVTPVAPASCIGGWICKCWPSAWTASHLVVPVPLLFNALLLMLCLCSCGVHSGWWCVDQVLLESSSEPEGDGFPPVKPAFVHNKPTWLDFGFRAQKAIYAGFVRPQREGTESLALPLSLYLWFIFCFETSKEKSQAAGCC